MTVCPSCSTENPGSAKFCFECGAALEALCPECSNPLPKPDAKFCPTCGARLKKEEETGQMLKLVSILFADVVSSTARAEQMYPEDIRALMADFFEAMTEEIRAEGGRIEKFIGDAIMAVFGVPTAHEDDPVRAVRAARRMLKRLESWNIDREPLHQINLRIGVNTGDVLAAATPGQDLMVTGDAVNVAARLEQASTAGNIVIGPRTAAVVRPFFVFNELEPLSLKGKSEPMPAFMIESEKEVEELRGVSGIKTPLVGRERELGLLHTALEEVEIARRPQIVSVIAEPGVGKSRLIHEFTSSVEMKAKIVGGRCLPYGEGVTLWPLGEILKGETGIHHNDSPEVAIEKLIKLVREVIPLELTPDRDRAVAGLASTLGLADALDPLGRLDPRERFQELLRSWRALFTALAADSPLIVNIEDIHWADPSMLEVLDTLNNTIQAPVLFLCPTRPDLFTGHPEWETPTANKSLIFLEHLTAEQSAFLMSSLLDQAELPRRLQERILTRSEGNPFFLEEIIRRLMDEGQLIHDGSEWKAAEGIDDVEIPDNVQGVILARIDLLPPAEKQVIQTASVMGRVFWIGGLTQLSGGADIRKVLKHLEHRELIFENRSSSMAGETEYSFKHILIRDVAYETLPRKRRGRSHVAVANWLEEISGPRVEELAELLAHHYHQAFTFAKEDPLRLKAKDYYGMASQSACRRFAIQQASVFGWLVVDLSNRGDEKVESLESLGDLYFMTGRMDGAWNAYKDALTELVEEEVESPQLQSRLASKAAIVPTRWEPAMTTIISKEEIDLMIDLGLEVAGAEDSRERCILLVSKAFEQIYGYQDMDDEGRAAASAALDMAERLGDPDLVSSALDAVSSWLIPEGGYADMETVARRRVALIPQLQDLKEICDAYITATWSSIFVGHYSEAVDFATACIERARGIEPASYSLGLAKRAQARFMVGDWDGCLEDLAEIEQLEVESEEELPAPFVMTAYGFGMFCHHLRGEDDKADIYLDLLRKFDEQQEVTEHEGPTQRGAIFARTLAHRGDTELARAMLSSERSAVLCSHLESLSEVVAGDEVAQANEIVLMGREEAARCGLLALPCFIDRLAGRLAAREGRWEEAAVFERRSAEGFQSLNAPWEEALSRTILAEAMILNGQRSMAELELQLVLPVFAGLRSIEELAHTEKLLVELNR